MSPYILIACMILVQDLYNALSGVKDAILYSLKGHRAIKHEHLLFSIERVTVFLIFLSTIFLDFPSVADALVFVGISGLCWLFRFSFMHNGCYNIARKRIDGAYNSWWDNHPGSSSNVNLSARRRTILYIVGLIFSFLALPTVL